MAGFQSSQDDSGLMNSINITPFVDVVLVLLVIFMVTAPMLVKEVMGLQLPKTATSDGQVTQTLGIAINKEGTILLGGQPIDDEGLRVATKEALAKNPDVQGIIAADTEVVYGRVVKVIDLLKSVGLNKFAVQIEKQDGP